MAIRFFLFCKQSLPGALFLPADLGSPRPAFSAVFTSILKNACDIMSSRPSNEVLNGAAERNAFPLGREGGESREIGI